jgi:hypothetical protein
MLTMFHCFQEQLLKQLASEQYAATCCNDMLQLAQQEEYNNASSIMNEAHTPWRQSTEVDVPGSFKSLSTEQGQSQQAMTDQQQDNDNEAMGKEKIPLAWNSRVRGEATEQNVSLPPATDYRSSISGVDSVSLVTPEVAVSSNQITTWAAKQKARQSAAVEQKVKAAAAAKKKTQDEAAAAVLKKAKGEARADASPLATQASRRFSSSFLSPKPKPAAAVSPCCRE